MRIKQSYLSLCLLATSQLALVVSAHAQSVPAAPSPPEGSIADNQPAQGDGDIVVLGVRGAQNAAVDIKRKANQIVDSIVAEDIGKLPDTTIADSLQRVPGIQIGRSAGEGSSVNIRGLGQVLVTINGEQFLGGSNIDGAQPNFTDIPPTLFSGVDVYKSPTARQVEGGVSGIIDLKTRRPLDLKQGLNLAGSAQGNYGSYIKHLNQDYSALIGWRNDRFGILIAGSYSKSRLANVSINTGNSWLASADTRATQGYVFQPAVVSATNRETERERYGLNASAQYKLTDALTVTADLAYTRLDNRDRSVQIQLNSGYAPLALQPGSIVQSNGVVTTGQFNFPSFLVDSLSAGSKSEAYNTNLQFDYDDGGPFKMTARWVHGDATRDSESSQLDAKPVRGSLIKRGTTAACRAQPTSAGCQIYANPNGLPTVGAGIAYGGKYPTLNFVDDVTSPNLYNIMSTWGFGDARKSTFDAIRLDGNYETGSSFLRSVDFGARFFKKSVSVSNFKYLAPVTVDGLGLLDRPGDLYFFKDPQIGHTGRPQISGLSVLPLYPFAAVPNITRNFSNFLVGGIPANGLPAVDPRAMDDALAFQNSLFPGNKAYIEPSTSFRVRERSVTGYVQANLEGDLVLPFTGNVGVRLIKTQRTVFSNTTDPNQFIGTGGSYNGVAVNLGTTATTKDFTRLLPSANLTFEVSPNDKLRLAYSKVVGELNLFDLGAGRVLYYGVNNGRYPDQPDDLQVFLQGNSGNPNLDPYQANNYNASLEHYFGKGGLISVAAFLFDVKSFPQVINTIQPIADQDGVVRAGGVITQTGNGKGGTIKGVEVGYQQQFDFLPGALEGLGAGANYTFSDSSSSNRDLFGNTLPVPDNSKHQVNLISFYQKGPIQARIAYNWRSKRYVGLQPINCSAPVKCPSTTDNLAIFSKPVGYLDASASYDITPNVTIFAQGTNLTKAFDQQYLQFKELYFSQSVFERRLTFGIRIRN